MSWSTFNLQMVPGTTEALDALKYAAGFFIEALGFVSSALEYAGTILGILADQVEEILQQAINALQVAIDVLYDLMNTGIYNYTDESLFWKPLGNGSDGVEGFMARWVESFDDTGNSERPQFSGSEAVTASLFVIGVDSLPDLSRIMELFGELFDIPSLTWMADKLEVDMPGRIEGETSTPPDWESTTLFEVLKPLGEVMDLLKNAAGLLALGSALSSAIDALVDAIQVKILALQAIIEEIESVIAIVTALIETAGLYILRVDANGIESLKTQAYEAERPPLNRDAYVLGGCFLAATADFGNVATVLGI